ACADAAVHRPGAGDDLHVTAVGRQLEHGRRPHAQRLGRRLRRLAHQTGPVDAGQRTQTQLGEYALLAGPPLGRLLRAVPVGDVVDDALDQPGDGRRLGHPTALVVHPADGAVAADDAVLEVEVVAAGEHRPVAAVDVVAVVGMDAVEPGGVAPHPLLDRDLEDLLDLRADVDADAVGAVQVGDQRHLLDQVAVAGLGGAQRLAGLLDLGDVDGHAVPADQEAVVAAHLGLDVARPDHPAVDGHHPVG